jgi:pyridoxine/pyridoxamine 5'-phosphate oxidase
MARLWRLARQHSSAIGKHLDCAAKSRHYVRVMDGQFDPLALDNADDFIAKALSLFARGVADRRAALHTLSLATTGLDGSPQLRTVVMRGLTAAPPALMFHTDARSPKYNELTRDARASALAYDSAAKLQIRMDGSVAMHHGDDFAAKIWAGLPRSSRECYHTPDAPSSQISQASPLTETQARDIFCVCTLIISKIDVLYLRAAGHLRAVAASGQAHWVAP